VVFVYVIVAFSFGTSFDKKVFCIIVAFVCVWFGIINQNICPFKIMYWGASIGGLLRSRIRLGSSCAVHRILLFLL
jgi:hypothetical protein